MSTTPPRDHRIRSLVVAVFFVSLIATVVMSLSVMVHALSDPNPALRARYAARYLWEDFLVLAGWWMSVFGVAGSALFLWTNHAETDIHTAEPQDKAE